jgi:hypothetical protein
VLWGVDFRGSVVFSDFELFFALFLGLPLFLPFASFCGFLLLDDLLKLVLAFLVF